MPRKKTWSFFAELRKALRKIYRESPMKREDKKKLLDGRKEFDCPDCEKEWPWEMADVDHEPPCGSLLTDADIVPFIHRLLHGRVQLLCKRCHKKKSARQRNK